MKEEFEKELQELSPFLADLKKQQKSEPFKTPRLYFDNLANQVLEKAKGETKTIKVPPQYSSFPSLANRINDWLSIAFQPKWALSALAFALIVGAGWYAVQQQKTAVIAVEQPIALTHEEAQNYVKENIQEFKEEDIVTALTESPKTNKEDKSVTNKSTQIKPAQKEEPVLKHPKSGLTEAEIEQYLKENLDERDVYASGNI